MTKTCGFCGCGFRTVSQEHLWPEWIRKIVIETRGEEGKRYLVEHERHGTTTRFQSTKLATKIGMPCQTCNNGWMSRLENSVKPFMSGMVFPGHKTLLDEDRRRHLARWAVKTAMVFEFFKEDGLFYFTPEDRRAFMESTQPPNDVWVWLGKYDATKSMRASQDRKINNATKAIHFYSLTLTANFFAVQVVASRHLGAVRKVPVAEMPKDSLVTIWPANCGAGEFVEWPPRLMMGPTELRVLDTRFRDGETRQWTDGEIEN